MNRNLETRVKISKKRDENKGTPQLSQSCGEFRVNCDVPLLRDTSPQVLSETLVLK